MTAIAATRPHVDSLKTPLILAVALHGCILVFAFVGAFLSSRGNAWSAAGGGGAVAVGAVSSLPAIPLPEPDVQTPNRVVDNSKGLFENEPKAAPVVPPDATPIPKFEKDKPPKYQTHPKAESPIPPPPQYNSRPSRLLDAPTTPPPNAVPYGQGRARDSARRFHHGRHGRDVGRHSNERRRWRLRFSIRVVCDGRRADNQQELARINDRSIRDMGTASRRDVRHSS